MGKKYLRNGEITDFNELFELADNRQPVIWVAGFTYKTDVIRPAAFFLQWPLAKLRNTQLFKTKKIEDGTQDSRK